MKKIVTGLLALSIATVSVFGADGKAIANKLKISANEKATSQWTRIFADADKLAKLGAGGLSDGDKNALKDYLVKHAADSNTPEAAGM